jgi:LytR cell envelope-related transcriptional attenuator
MDRFRTPLTLLVLLLVLFGGAVYGWSAVVGDGGSDDQSTTPQDCSTRTLSPGGRLQASQVTVSVFNAGTVQGLATETLNKLHKRGFEKGAVADATATVSKVAVWTSTPDDPAVSLVARQFRGRARIVNTDSVLGEGINVIVGNQFKGLSKKAQTSITVTEPAAVCTSTQTR